MKTITKREIEVLNQVALGLTTKEIAGKLSLSIETIKTHRRHLFAKLCVRNSIELVMKAHETNLLIKKVTFLGD